MPLIEIYRRHYARYSRLSRFIAAAAMLRMI